VVAKVVAGAPAAVVAADVEEAGAGVADARSTHGFTLPMTGAMTEPEPIRKTRLRSGLRIVTERLPGLRSAAVGCWVGTGSRDEPEVLAGASHFLEHLLFKGTDRRSAVEIAEAVESVGGDMNAFTAQELTAYYVRVPDTSLPVAIDILSDILWSPALREEDVDCERQVILEEIRMRDDTPDDLVHDLFSNAVFPDHPIGREVIGSPETIRAMSRADIAGFHAEHYHPSNVVIAVAGNIEHDQVAELVESAMVGVVGDRPPRSHHDGRPGPRAVAVLERPTEQTHLVLGMRSLRRDDPDRYALTVLNQVFGGGMSSRLFQDVREQRGLAYSVFSYRAAFEETGALAIYAGTSPERVPELLQVLDDQLDRLVTDRGVTERELVAAKGHLAGSLSLSLESSSSRMHRLGRSELTMNEIPTLDELVAEIDKVTPDDIARVVDRVVAAPERTVAAVGPVTEASLADVAERHSPAA
jgi:predicted Zn-dependent peptidase